MIVLRTTVMAARTEIAMTSATPGFCLPVRNHTPKNTTAAMMPRMIPSLRRSATDWSGRNGENAKIASTSTPRGVQTARKNSGVTEISWLRSTRRNSGYIVPQRTATVSAIMSTTSVR